LGKNKKNNEIQVNPNSVRDYIVNSEVMTKITIPLRYQKSDESINDIHLDIRTNINRLEWMENKWISLDYFEDVPLIVPPTWSKTEYHTFLSHVWRQAAEELTEAKYIFVIGYSIPDSDLFFQYLLGLGMLDIVRLKCFWVFDPSEDVIDRFKNYWEHLFMENSNHFHSFFQKML